MWSDRRLLELFEIEHPIVLAPMAGFGTVELAAAVADSGGLGSIGCATMNPQLAVETITASRERVCNSASYLGIISAKSNRSPIAVKYFTQPKAC